MPPRYKNDPYWLIARFGQCAECKANLKGKRAFYYPSVKKAYCEKCGEQHSRDFDAAAFDESAMTGNW